MNEPSHPTALVPQSEPTPSSEVNQPRLASHPDNEAPEDDSSGRDSYDETDRKRYKYCCRKCKHTEKGRKACVCVVPLSQRRAYLGEGGCQTCSCIGCSIEDFLQRGEDPQYKPTDRPTQESIISEGFQARNGCCRRCMKAFSRTNKACLCQVPKEVRQTELPPTGCKYCRCMGCHPEDKRGDTDRRSSDSERSYRKGRRPHAQRSESQESEIINPMAYNLQNFDRSGKFQIMQSSAPSSTTNSSCTDRWWALAFRSALRRIYWVGRTDDVLYWISMGISLSSPCPKTLIDEYIVGLPQFPDGVRTGDEVYQWYRQQARFEDISVFNDIRLQRKFKEVAATPEECNYLNSKAVEINQLSQRIFEKKFPEYAA